MPTTLKVTLPDGSLKKIKVAKEDLHDFATFHNKLKDKFDVLENCTMNYTDEDGDVCLLDDDDSLEDAKTTMDKDTLRLVLKIKVRSHVPPLSAASSASAAVGGSEHQDQKRTEVDAEAKHKAADEERKAREAAEAKRKAAEEEQKAREAAEDLEEQRKAKERRKALEEQRQAKERREALEEERKAEERRKFLEEERNAEERHKFLEEERDTDERRKAEKKPEAVSPAERATFGRQLCKVAQHGIVKDVKYLIQARADINVKEDTEGGFGGWTSLMGASRSGHMEVVKALVEARAELNANDYGRTALSFAMEWDHRNSDKCPALTQYLRSVGATM
mmetsp:Transcript_144950/g.464538  ORF Transcript_144950/g.464538 Transcript_144950/m.464538 type:complete len:335 (+) Transcript_144950:121-1125(+)